jgi:hypothetical protein
MSVWWNDVEDYSGAREGTRNGMFGAFGFAAMLGFGALVLGMGGSLVEGLNIDPTARTIGLAMIGAEASVALLAAWRFRMGKGWLSGSIVLLLFVIEVGYKLFSGFLGIAWYVFYLAIFLGLMNGIRGAWALREMGAEPTDLSDTFG